jgi:hypothetical protein
MRAGAMELEADFRQTNSAFMAKFCFKLGMVGYSLQTYK